MTPTIYKSAVESTAGFAMTVLGNVPIWVLNAEPWFKLAGLVLSVVGAALAAYGWRGTIRLNRIREQAEANRTCWDCIKNNQGRWPEKCLVPEEDRPGQCPMKSTRIVS